MTALPRLAAIFTAAAALAALPALAATETGFQDSQSGLFGRYAPLGDCSKGPIITIAADGITYQVGTRRVHPPQFETAYSLFGNDYQGIQIGIFPFIKSAENYDYGASSMTLNADEVPGKITFEVSNPPGSATENALAAASPYMRCGPPPAPKPAAEAPPAPPPAMPLDWAMLPSVVGKFDANFDMFDKGEVAAALRTLIGGKIAVLQRNLDVRGPIQREGPLYYLSGNAEHLGGEEQAYVLLDPARKQVQVGLWEKGKLTVYAPPRGRLPIPQPLTELLDQSPPETATALPGTPWEVIRTSAQLPLATVDAAGSVDISSFSIFCDQGRPKLAMLLNKRPRGTTSMLTWVFAGRTVNVPLMQGNQEGTFWLAWLDNSPLLQMISGGSAPAYLRIDGVMEGQASLNGSTVALRTALNGCARI